MAAKITTQHADVRRSEVLLLHPADIAADPGRNSRHDPHDAEAVASIAESLRRDGQMQPVLIRKRHDGTAELVAGFRRHAAAVLIAASDANFRLRCTLVNCNDEEAFRLNVVENLERRETSPLDDAFAQERLRRQYGWEDERIAGLYGKSASYISRLAKLLTLPTEIQRKVAAREIGLQAAFDLATVEPDAAVAIADDACSDGEIKERIAEAKRERGVSVKRTVKELREFLADICDLGWPANMLDWLDGKIATPECEELMRGAK